MKHPIILIVISCLWTSTALAAPIHDAAKAGDVKRIEALLNAGAKVNARMADQSILEKPLPCDKKKSGWCPDPRFDPADESDLIEYPKTIDGVRHRATPLHFAAGAGHPQAVKVLLDAGANPNAKTSREVTPLRLATEGVHQTEGSIKPYLKVIEILTKHGARER